MLLNLKKSFRFTSENDTYQVGYIFHKEELKDNDSKKSDILLTVTFSINGGHETVERTPGASFILTQSNESIQKLIEDKLLAVSFKES